jgi:methylated-DNA-[protein]-cysteine S-methyltransferase
MRIVASRRGIQAIDFARSGLMPTTHLPPDGAAQALIVQAETQLEEYFAGTRKVFDLPLDVSGTPFQRAVWDSLQRVPYGQTITYRELAVAAGRPSAIRAAGAANGANPLSIIIPCHRILGSNGALTGYAGGLTRKRFLLDLEANAS